MKNIIEQLKHTHQHKLNLVKAYELDIANSEQQIAKAKEQIAKTLQEAEETREAITKLEAP